MKGFRMNKVILFVAIGILVCNPKALAGDDDLQFQFKNEIAHDLNNVWKMSISEKLSYNDTGTLLAHESDIGFAYSGLAEWLTLSWNFRYAEANSDGSNWKREYRPHFNVKIKDKIGDFPWSNRARIEFRDFDEKKDQWRFRNKLLVDMPFRIPILNATPYTGDEVLFNLSENGYNQNRLYAGLKLKPTDNFKVNLYYYWLRVQRSSGWDEASILGADLTFKF